jgi:hypothetical protein
MAGIINFSEQGSAPSSPTAGRWNIYSTSDGFSIQDSTGGTGLLPILSGNATDFLNGTGAWSTPAGGSGGGKYPMNGRLTLLSGTPVTTSDYATTDATTLYLTPYMGDEIGLHDGSTDTTAWTTYTLSNEPHIHLDATTDYTSSDNFDIWAYPTTDSVVELASTKWTNDTTRATALTTVAGVYCKTAATNYRYIGTIRMLAEGQTEDSVLRRFVWNYYNRCLRKLKAIDTTDTWSYTTNTLRPANNSTANRVESVVGVVEDTLKVKVVGASDNTTSTTRANAIGVNSTSVATSDLSDQTAYHATIGPHHAYLDSFPTLGYSYYQWLEISQAAGTTTWYGDGVVGGQAGITGEVLG